MLAVGADHEQARARALAVEVDQARGAEVDQALNQAVNTQTQLEALAEARRAGEAEADLTAEEHTSVLRDKSGTDGPDVAVGHQVQASLGPAAQPGQFVPARPAPKTVATSERAQMLRDRQQPCQPGRGVGR